MRNRKKEIYLSPKESFEQFPIIHFRNETAELDYPIYEKIPFSVPNSVEIFHWIWLKESATPCKCRIESCMGRNPVIIRLHYSR
jgi:hypothetical protein